MFNIPILLITFNRPDHVRKVLTEIRKQQPTQLFVCQDGAREGNTFDAERVQEVRDVINELVDWPCELHTLYQEKNLGCGPGPATGITWFFEQVEMGIVMEDDCVPSDTLLQFFAELLVKYKDDHTIALITGTNVLKRWKSYKGDYFISKTGGMTMGSWASWKRAWNLFEADLSSWGSDGKRNKLKKFTGTQEYKVYAPILNDIYRNSSKDIWDYQWAYSRWVNEKYCLVSTVNQMSNIGFCAESTHTSYYDSRRANIELMTCNFPLKIVSNRCDSLFDYVMFQRFTRKTKKGILLRGLLKVIEYIYKR